MLSYAALGERATEHGRLRCCTGTAHIHRTEAASLDGQYIARQEPDFLTSKEKFSWNGESRWRDGTGQRIYTYDRRHGHIEAYNKRGRHVGVLDAQSGVRISEAVTGRRIDV